MTEITEFKIGDIVRMTKGEPDTPGYQVEVRTVTEDVTGSPRVNLRTLKTIRNSDWKIELIERPATPLPTTPNTLGWATVGGVRSLARMAAGQWELYDTDGLLGGGAAPEHHRGLH